MRLRSVALLMLALAGSAFSQDTNFQVGPQYLITNGSSMTLRPIATPSLSLGEAQPFAANVSTIETLSETIPSAAAVPSRTFLGNVYWGEHNDNVTVGRRLETPSVTPSETAAYMNSVANQVAGVPPAPPEEIPENLPVVVELTGGSIPSNLPTSVFDPGVTGTTGTQSLTVRGLGVPLGDVAAYWKSHKRTAPHVFTNADVHRRG